MTQCYQNAFEFPRVCRRVVEARFAGGEITSDGGLLLLRQADRYLGLTEAVAGAVSDRRRRKSCIHDVHALTGFVAANRRSFRIVKNSRFQL